MPDPSDVWFWVANLTAAVLGGGWFAFRWLNIARTVEDTPTSRIRSASQGYVEIEGRAAALTGTRNLAPLTQRECAWWRYRVQHLDDSRNSKRERWRTIASACSGLPFQVDDGTGTCIVQPDGATVLALDSTTWYGSAPWPASLPGASGRRGSGTRYRYFEERINLHELVYALGEFRSVSGTDGGGPDEAVRVLLAEWKTDPAGLARRFDRDGDGSVSLQEWQAARAEARRTVERARVERPAVAARHVLGEPGGGRLFLLATFRAADVARRYRRRAVWAFAGFVAAVYALGWLVQGVWSNA